MWLDDEGDDDPIGGPVPDPSARHWRHPSEVAAENAGLERAFAAAGPAGGPNGAGRASGSASILWPISVVGGSIAVAAFGVLGLYLMGSSSSDDVVAGGAPPDPAGAIDANLSNRSRAVVRQPGSERAAADPEGDADDGAEASAADRDRPTTTQGSTNTVSLTSTSLSTTTSTTSEAVATTVVPLADGVGADPAIHAGGHLGSERLASFVATDRYLITSASAIGDRQLVYVRIDGALFEAEVVGRDMPSDVAVVVPLGSADELELPIAAVSSETIHYGVQAFVGYCDGEQGANIEPDRTRTEDRTSGDGPVTDRSGPATEWRETASRASDNPANASAYRSPEPGCGDGLNLADERTDPGPVPTTTPQHSKTNPRAGVIYSTGDWSTTLSDHTVYEPIRTGIQRSDDMAGAPLRDRWGGVTGVVIGSSEIHVSATPIERALTIADSLYELGVGSPTWIGLEGRATATGFELSQVEQSGPAAELLQPGDVVLTVNGEALRDQDHLIHLVRRAGVGETLLISFVRTGTKVEAVELVIGAVIETR